MRKIFILALMVLVGIGLCFSNSRADEARTIPMKSGTALSASTVISAHGATVYQVIGYAASANAVYSVHNAATVLTAGNSNVMAEGGEASQYDSFPTINFGTDGLNFDTGVTVITTTASVNVLYR